RFLVARGFAPIGPSPRGGRDFRWVVVSVLFMLVGAIWAIPMALAGGAQRRYINFTSAYWRDAAARSLRQMMNHDADSLHLPRRVCRNPHCRARLPQDAMYCPR